MTKFFDASNLAEISIKSLRNSRRLIDDARLLADSERWTTAYVVAVFAAEEFGKHVMVTSFPFSRDGSEVEFKLLDKRMRSHEAKVTNALVGGWLTDPLDFRDLPSREDAHDSRLRLLYVDLLPSGEVSDPSSSVDASVTESFVSRIERHVSDSELVLGSQTVESLSTAMSRAFEERGGSKSGSGDSFSFTESIIRIGRSFGIDDGALREFADFLAGYDWSIVDDIDGAP